MCKNNYYSINHKNFNIHHYRITNNHHNLKNFPFLFNNFNLYKNLNTPIIYLFTFCYIKYHKYFNFLKFLFPQLGNIFYFNYIYFTNFSARSKILFKNKIHFNNFHNLFKNSENCQSFSQ